MAVAFDDRIVRVGIEINGETQIFDGVNIVARGTKYRSAVLGKCELKIFNLTREHQQYILTKASPILPRNNTPIKVTLDAGRKSYGTFRLFEGACFQGGVTQPPDIGIILQSLVNNFEFAVATATSFGEFSTIQQIASKVAQDMGCTLLMKSKHPEQLVTNYSSTGSPIRGLQKLNENGVIAYVDNKVLVVVDPDQARGDTPLQINASTGMVVVPQPTAAGCIVRVMLGQGIEVGDEVEIKSVQNPAVNGNYIITQLDYEVSNREDPFFYTLQCQNKNFYFGTQG